MVLLCIKPVHKNTWLFFLLWGCQHKVTRNIRNKENGPKEQSKSPETNPKEMEVYELPDKELKITIIKILMSSRVQCINKMRISTKRKYEKEPNKF